MLAYTDADTHMEMRKINFPSKKHGDGAMTLKFMPVIKDQTRNLMKMLDARRLDLRVKESAWCHHATLPCVINAGDGDGTVDK